MRHAVAALGATQIISYGTLFYAFPIAAPAMAAELGVAEGVLYAAFSAGLLAGGLIAPLAGRTMDRIGPARLMAAGSLAAVLVLAGLAALPLGLAGTILAIMALELVAVCVTYDAAFATLAVLRGAGARRAITRLTLIAGFASTLFWPLTGWLVEGFGWRAAFGVFAALHLAVAWPLHRALARARHDPETAPTGARAPSFAPLPAALARRGFVLLASSFTLTGVLIAALVVHMVPVLQGLGFGTAAFAVAMVMGPAQVAIRLVDALAWQGLHPVSVALVSAVVTPLGALVLLAAPGSLAAAVAFAALFGAGQGLASIVRGSVPLALFGAAGYGAMLGRLAGIRQVAAALAPLGFALALTGLGTGAALGLAVAVGVAGVVPLLALAVLVRRAASG